MIITAILIGAFIVPRCIDFNLGNSKQEIMGQDRQHTEWNAPLLKMIGAFYLLIFLVTMLNRNQSRPNIMYAKYPFLTGCSLMYSTQINDLVESRVYVGGAAVRHIEKPDRVIIGAEYDTNEDAMRQIEI